MILVAWKWVTASGGGRGQPGDGPAVEHGREPGDARWSGISDADRAALEVALRLAAADAGRGAAAEQVTVVSVGGPGGEQGLREALAIGATRAVRVDAPVGLSSAAVARAIAAVAADARWVVCGDVSADRGTGAVPAMVAAELGVAQALGLLGVEAGGTAPDGTAPGSTAPDGTAPDGTVRVIRRLDGGRREVLELDAPAVISVEGGVARLRRAALPAELAARRAVIEVVPGPAGPVDRPDAVRPYRPRARTLPAPVGGTLQRIRSLTDAGGQPTTGTETVVLDPAAAAERILSSLREWGYLDLPLP